MFITASDLNSDGKFDIIDANIKANNIVIFLNNGTDMI